MTKYPAWPAGFHKAVFELRAQDVSWDDMEDQLKQRLPILNQDKFAVRSFGQAALKAAIAAARRDKLVDPNVIARYEAGIKRRSKEHAASLCRTPAKLAHTEYIHKQALRAKAAGLKGDLHSYSEDWITAPENPMNQRSTADKNEHARATIEGRERARENDRRRYYSGSKGGSKKAIKVQKESAKAALQKEADELDF